MNAFLRTYLRRLESEFTGRNSGNRGQFNLAFFPLSTSICCGGAEKRTSHLLTVSGLSELLESEKNKNI